MKPHFIFGALLSMVCSVAAAADSNYGAWRYTAAGDISQAFSISDSGAEFGLLCSRSKNSCVYFLESSSKCEDGHAYPILVNGAGAADTLTGTCHILDNGGSQINALVLSPFNDIASLVSSGGMIGFAQPMVDGQFLVFRFQLDGSQAAISAASTYASEKTGDQAL